MPPYGITCAFHSLSLRDTPHLSLGEPVEVLLEPPAIGAGSRREREKFRSSDCTAWRYKKIESNPELYGVVREVWRVALTHKGPLIGGLGLCRHLQLEQTYHTCVEQSAEENPQGSLRSLPLQVH